MQPKKAKVVVRLKDHMLRIADSSLVPLAIPPVKLTKQDPDTEETTEEMELLPRLYFTTAVWMPGPHEVTDFRRFIPNDMRYPNAVIEAAVQLWDAGYLCQSIQGRVIALTRGKPGSRDYPAPWPTLSAIPDGHAGLYPDNLTTSDADIALRRGFPRTLEIGEDEEP
eukprot:3875702-Rhodomonas_salina.1